MGRKKKNATVAELVREDLPVSLTPDELGNLAHRAGELLVEIRTLETKKKEQASVMKGRIDEKRGELSEIAEKLKDRRELRPVKLIEEKDFDKGLSIIRRADTQEIVRQRPLTHDDLQRSIDEVAAEKAASEKATSTLEQALDVQPALEHPEAQAETSTPAGTDAGGQPLDEGAPEIDPTTGLTAEDLEKHAHLEEMVAEQLPADTEIPSAEDAARDAEIERLQENEAKRLEAKEAGLPPPAEAFDFPEETAPSELLDSPDELERLAQVMRDEGGSKS